MAFLTSSDKALWHLALPMIFSDISPFRCWDWSIRRLLVILIVRFIWRRGGWCNGDQLSLYAVAVFTHEHHRADCAGHGAKNPQALARALVQPLLLALGAGALIALLRTPIIDLALHIVGGSEAVLKQARRFLNPLVKRTGVAGESGITLLVTRRAICPCSSNFVSGRQYPQHCAGCLGAVMGLHMNVRGAALATVIAEYATLLIGLLMVRKILKLRGISGEMLKTAWRGNFRRLLALNRDIMLRSLLLQLCFGAITVLGARLGSDIIAVNAVLMTLLTFTAYALDGFAYAVEAHSGQAYGARR